MRLAIFIICAGLAMLLGAGGMWFYIHSPYEIVERRKSLPPILHSLPMGPPSAFGPLPEVLPTAAPAPAPMVQVAPQPQPEAAPARRPKPKAKKPSASQSALRSKWSGAPAKKPAPEPQFNLLEFFNGR